MKKLQLNNMIRYESDASIIDTLVRKGWQIKQNIGTPPEYDVNTEKVVYDESTDSWSVVPLTQQELDEIQETLAQGEIFAANQQIHSTISQGYAVNPENFTLGLSDSDRNAFTQMLALIKEALDLGLIDNDAPQTISDKSGQKHTITTLRFRQIMVQYGLYYKALWDQLINI